MNAQPLSADSLLAHEPFVRAVVRGLVRDESELQDVLQETWLRGLGGAPAEGGALRGWLARVARNLALDQRRGRARRMRRERTSARTEAVDGADAAYARLSTQREVVDAVLALAEPYRGVVLLRYFEGLEPTAIAARLARSSGTVRSQLARAHELLRERLDRSCGRDAWSALAFPLAWRGAGVTLKVASLAAGGLLVLAGLRWMTSSSEPRSATLAALAPAGSSPIAPGGAELSAPPVVPEPARSTATSVAFEPALAVSPPPVAELVARPLDDRLALAVQLMRTIQDDLVRVEPELVAANRNFLSQPDTGLTRIRNDRESKLVLDREGRAYFSFATRGYSYDAEPDISFSQGTLHGGFYGQQVGLLYDAGPIRLDEVPARGEPIPGWVPVERLEDWSALWGAIDDSNRDELRSRRTLQGKMDPNLGDSFLLRVQSPGEHDHIVAFSVLGKDADSVTLLWRILARWPVARTAGRKAFADEHREVPASPAWLAELSTEERIRMLGDLRVSAQSALLDVPKEARNRFAQLAPDARFARLLPRDRWDPLLESTWEGSYYSFEKASNDYQTSILGLEQELYSGFAGRDQGLFVDLGRLTDAQLRTAWNGTLPAGLGPRARDAWDFLFRVQPERDPAQRSAQFSNADAARAKELGLRDRASVAIGHVYLLRSVLFGDRDELVCFQVLDREHEGVSLAWKELASFPIDGR